jgi:hypothetical protein
VRLLGVQSERACLRGSFPNYMALMSSIIDVEPSSFEEATDQQVWRDSMVEEYTSIMRNDVWDIVSKTRGEVSCEFQVALQDQACCIW